MARVKVTINKKGHIPSLGVGPFRRPILIQQELCDHLIKLGYPVKIIDSPIKKQLEATNVVAETKKAVEAEPEAAAEVKEPAVVKEEKTELPTEEVVEVVSKADEANVEEEPTSEAHEEDADEATEEEVKVNDLDLAGTSYYTEDFLTSKNRCKKILAARTVQYDSSASLELLKKLVLDSNPEVEIVEE